MGKLKDDFVREVRKVNSHFERRVKSSLRPIMTILDRMPDPRPPAPAVPTSGDLDALAKAIADLNESKAKKYAKALDWLNRSVAGLEAKRTKTLPAIGRTTLGYAPGKEVRYPDKDGRWHRFYLQERGNSCGPTSTRTILLAHTHIKTPSEKSIRDHFGLLIHNMANTGVDDSGHDWENVGTGIEPTVKVLQHFGLRDARLVKGWQQRREELAKSSQNCPALIGWLWQPPPAGGHLTTCVGLTRSGNELIILDPWTQVGYVDASAPWNYFPSGGGHGQMAAVVVTHPK
jgi:hypothetical protein